MLLVLYYCVLKQTNFKIALPMQLPSWNWLKAKKHTKLNQLCHKQ